MEQEQTQFLHCYFDLFQSQNKEMLQQNEINYFRGVKTLIGKVNPSISTIKSNSTCSSICVYQFLRFYQQIRYQLFNYQLNPSEENYNEDLNKLLSDISSMVNQLQNGNDIGETCGWEFLRFAGNRFLMSSFSLSSDINNYFAPPKKEFLNTILPQDLRIIIQKGLSSSDQNAQEILNFIPRKSNEMLYFIICDLIRLVFSIEQVPPNKKTNYLKSILSILPNWSQLINTFDICLALTIDLLSFRSGIVNDDTNIKVCVNLIREFPDLLTFVENFAKKNPSLLLSLAEVSKRLKQPDLFPHLTLPSLSPEKQTVETKTALDGLVKRLKYTKNLALTNPFLVAFGNSIMPNLDSCMFKIPFTPTDDLQLILDTGNPFVIATVCESNPNVFKLAVYSLRNKVEILKQVLSILSKSTTAKTFLLSSLSKVLVITPELFKTLINDSLIPQDEDIDPTPFIRYISYNLTDDCIYKITNRTKNPYLFPSNVNYIESILMESLGWGETTQKSLWFFINNSITQSQPVKTGLLSVINKVLQSLSNHPVHLFNIKLMLQRMKLDDPPTTPLLKGIVETFMNGDSKLYKTFYMILKSWFNTFAKETIEFFRNLKTVPKAFLVELERLDSAKTLEPLIQQLG